MKKCQQCQKGWEDCACPIADDHGPVLPKFIDAPPIGVTDPSPADNLRSSAALFEERNAAYGNNYKEFGHLLAILLAGYAPDTGEDWAQLNVIINCAAKLYRHCSQLKTGKVPDLDHPRDLQVYAAMLEELTRGME